MSELQAGMQIELDDNMGTIQIVRKLGEGIAIPDKVLCQKGFDTGCTGGGFFS